MCGIGREREIEIEKETVTMTVVSGHLLGFVVVERSSAEHEPAFDPGFAPQSFLLLHQPTFTLSTAEVLARDTPRR